MSWFKTLWNKLTQAANESANAPGLDESYLNFTPRARQVVSLARMRASRWNRPGVGTEDLLYGLIELGEGVAFNVLKRSRPDFEAVCQEVRKQARSPSGKEPAPGTPEIQPLQQIFRIAREEAASLHHTYIGTEHLLLGLLREDDGAAARVLRQFNVDLDHTRQEILRELDPNFLAEDTPPTEPPQD